LPDLSGQSLPNKLGNYENFDLSRIQKSKHFHVRQIEQAAKLHRAAFVFIPLKCCNILSFERAQKKLGTILAHRQSVRRVG